MNAQVQHAIETIRQTLETECDPLGTSDYKEVLEEFLADVEGRLDVLKEGNPDLFD